MKQSQKSKDIQREFLIRYSIKHNYSFNRTQKFLIRKQVGIRRQVLLTKLRVLKKQEKKKYLSRYIPKKYIKKGFAQKQWKERAEEQIKLYRIGWTIKNVPLHSSSQKPIYYGFLIQGFSIDLEFLRSKVYGLKSKMMDLMMQHLISQNYIDDLKGYISYESPVEIVKNLRVNNIWKFKVEKNGVVIDESEGSLQTI